jgi:transposase
MFLRTHKRWKNGKHHRYFSVVENRRVAGGKVAQRTVLYLGEINDSQQAAWRKTLEVFDEVRSESRQLSLFPEDRPIPADAPGAIQVRLSQMTLRRPRAFGNCWLGCRLWKQLGLDVFWQRRLADQRGDVPWEKVLELLVVHRLLDPGSEYRLHRQWFDRSAMDELLGVDFRAATKDRLYRCLDRLLGHKEELFQHLRRRWRSLFDADFDVLLYDLTSTYFEGLCEQNPKACHGYSRDGRPDCRQVVIGLIVTPRGLPLGYEVLPGNTADSTTLKDFLAKIERMYGRARRVWVMDRGIPSEAVLAEMRQAGVDYLVGTPKSQLRRFEEPLVQRTWQEVRQDVRVKLLAEDGEVYVLVQSRDRRRKERAMRHRKLRKLLDGLGRLQARCRNRDRLLEKLGALKHPAGRAAKLVEITIPSADQEVTPETFRFRLNRQAYQRAARRDGAYLLRTTLPPENPQRLWEHYMVLTEVEAAFRTIKSDLAIRPVYHQLEHRVEAHIFVAFLSYCLMVTLKNLLRPHAPGLTAPATLEMLATIQMVDVWLPTTDGRWLVMSRHTQPEPEHKMLLKLLGLTLPPQPPPRITAEHVSERATPGPPL